MCSRHLATTFQPTPTGETGGRKTDHDNPIVHVEFAGPDEKALQRFYGDLMSWPVNAARPGYARVETPDGSPNGALRESEKAEAVK